MSGYVELKIRTTGNLSNKFISGLLEEIATVLKAAGHEGQVKCTNTKDSVEFNKEESVPKLKPVKEADGENLLDS